MKIFRDWLVTFGLIIIKPLPQTFITEAKKAKGKFTSSILWLGLTAILFLIYSWHIFKQSPSLLTYWFTNLELFFTIPIAFIVFVYCIHRFYQRFSINGKNVHMKLFYVCCGIFVPCLLIILGMRFIPTVGKLLSWFFLIYSLMLIENAIITITKMKTWQAIIALIASCLIGIFSLFFGSYFLGFLLFHHF
jgi:hypothetical protein